jgi:hypothetical protein
MRGSLRVRHEADDVALAIAYSSDVVDRPIGVVEVAEHDPVLRLELGERFPVAGVVALEVVDRNAQPLTWR